MNTEQNALHQRLEAYAIDDPKAAMPFSARLAKENGWTAAYTQRVIREYKRFAFLAAVAGHVVTPSEQVDQAWHQHMTYTRSYWNDFCDGVLGKKLHHDPTQGGADEQEKFYALYEQTLESYRTFFGEEPPADIWPDAKTRFTDDIHFEWINRKRNWIIPKSLVGRVVRYTLLIGALPLLIGACAPVVGIPNPFDLVGPEFLVVYSFVLVLALVVASILRLGLLPMMYNPPPGLPELDIYQTAYLNQGAELTADTLIVRMVSNDYLEFDVETQLLKHKQLLSLDAHELEQRLYQYITSYGTGIQAVRAETKRIAERLDPTLREAGLLANEAEQRVRRTVPVVLLLGVALFGGIKILVGMSRERPIGILVMLCMVTLAAALLVFGRRVHRSQYGDRVFNQMKRAGISHFGDIHTYDYGPYNVALFGVAVMSTFGFQNLYTAMHPPSASGSDGGGGGCGGGCGGCGGCGG